MSNRVSDPITQFSSHIYDQFAGFWTKQLGEIFRELTLLPDKIRGIGSCFASKNLSLFLLLRRRCSAGKWEDVSYFLQQHHSWCIQMYHETSHLLEVNCTKCIRVLDCHRINMLLGAWGHQMSETCGYNEDIFFFTDGKPWKMSWPGRGRAVR